MKNIILNVGVFTVCLLTSLFQIGQTNISGKIVDLETQEKLLFASIMLYKDGNLITGTESDLDGNFQFTNIEPGNYTIEGNYVGYTTKKIENITIKKGNTTSIKLELSASQILDEIVVIDYKNPLIKLNNTTSGATITAEAIKSLPSKNINSIACTTTGVNTNQKNSLSVRSSRTNNTVYYIDGIRVSGVKPNIETTNEEYATIDENKPKSPFRDPLSTFSIDVDRASYSNVRRMLQNGQRPPVDAVRIEEMINYFNYDYPTPSKRRRPFKIYSELTNCPWNSNNKLLHIGVQGKKIETDNLPPSNLVFLIDVSGSMSAQNKLPLVKSSFKLLVDNLRKDDRVAIVTYAGRAGLHLPSTSASDKETIIRAIDELGTGGGTAGAQGIITAYHIAKENFKKKGNNRVILATDGDFNVGISDKEELVKLIEEKRNSGVYLSILGYGMGNYREGTMQALANKGNGNHAYIDNINEAKKILINEFGGTLFTIAKDVKIQVEFNPAYVGTYRLIGYENRKLNNENFTDDSKDAGELGAGHSVTAIYEITPPYGEFASIKGGLKYQKRSTILDNNEELATIKMRYKTPKGIKSWEIKEIIKNNTIPFDKVNERTIHAACIAEFGLLLKSSQYRENANYGSLIETLQQIENTKFPTDEVIRLAKTAQNLSYPK